MIREVIQLVNKHSQWPDNHPSFSVCFLELFQTMRGETEAHSTVRLELEWREQLKLGKVEFALWIREGAWRRALQLEPHRLLWKSGGSGSRIF